MKQHKVLYYYRNRYERNKSPANTLQYIAELEDYVPDEVIREYEYAETFRQVLSLCSQTFRPDHFDSYFGGLFQWLDFDFMEWLLAHQGGLKRLLTWKQIVELQCNYQGWRICNLPDMGLREMWEFNDEQQIKTLHDRIRKTTH